MKVEAASRSYDVLHLTAEMRNALVNAAQSEATMASQKTPSNTENGEMSSNNGHYGLPSNSRAGYDTTPTFVTYISSATTPKSGISAVLEYLSCT